MERFRLCLLGPFQALLDGKPITGFESNKTRALLAYLAVENSRPHSREVLAELLWPERPQGIALANLRHTLAGLRTAIGDHTAAQPCLLVAHQTLQFDPAILASGEAVVDACHFGALLADGRGASRTACAEAAALYRGQFLQGFTLHGSAEFEAWLVLQRERCDHLAAQALARLVQYGAEQGDYAQGAHWAQRLLEIDPWNEDVHRQLMWLLAACGERAAALRQYDACVRLFAAEFGTEPQPATLILADCIHAGEADLGQFPGGSPDGGPNGSSGVERLRGAGGGDARAAGGDVHNLPLAATPLVGRTHELEEIAQTLAAPGCRLLTITGPGGIGKTRLAMETAQRVASRFRDGAWFVDLAPAGEAAVLPSVLLKRLDALESGPAEARARLMAHLATKHMLLVLDNFEHLLDGADLVADMAAAAPALQILVTSRVRLNLREEWLQPLSGMELPPIPGAAPLELRANPPYGQAQFEHGPRASADLPVDLPVDLGAYDATRLFLACVRRLQPGFTPSPEEAQTIAAICCRLEGMPLAIELAASWIRSMPLRALAAEVENGLLRLETPLRNVPPRHRSMAAVFDQSWGLLTERERAILRGLSVFRGGATP
jgi:predicted ATPase/DNA-binding SARP family transcriptional activator